MPESSENNESSLPVRSADPPASSTKEEKTFVPERDIEPHILAKLDPEWVAVFTAQMKTNPPPPRELLSMDYIRAHPEKFAPPCWKDTKGYPRTAEKEVVSADGAKVPMRVYYPEEKIWGPGPYPVHLNFHGGGFVLGGLENESTLCMSMCDGAGVAVVDVNYRHCPETVFGKCFQDAFAALNWACDEAKSLNFNPSSISFGGISAGGTISLILHHMARDAGIPIKLVMASVPGSDTCLSYEFYTDSPRRSFHEFYRGPVLPWASIKWFGKLSQPSEKQEELKAMWPDWYFTPFKARNFKDLCPVFIRTGECDPLRDEGEAYGRKLVEEGVQVTVKRYIGAVHTFMFMKEFHRKREYDADAIAALKAAHGIK
ncbi:hypothetical protein N0V82_007571 [Gnomoniopsis sp. IMI 355080]|nr:hypothetical protein N0V82_007571 [Gnomoniopsis sp. IMI 355080]